MRRSFCFSFRVLESLTVIHTHILHTLLFYFQDCGSLQKLNYAIPMNSTLDIRR